MVETDLFSHIKHMLWDTIPAFAIALHFILVCRELQGSRYQTGDYDGINLIKTGLERVFTIHPLLLLMPIFTIIYNDETCTSHSGVDDCRPLRCCPLQWSFKGLPFLDCPSHDGWVFCGYGCSCGRFVVF